MSKMYHKAVHYQTLLLQVEMIWIQGLPKVHMHSIIIIIDSHAISLYLLELVKIHYTQPSLRPWKRILKLMKSRPYLLVERFVGCSVVWYAHIFIVYWLILAVLNSDIMLWPGNLGSVVLCTMSDTLHDHMFVKHNYIHAELHIMFATDHMTFQLYCKHCSIDGQWISVNL